MQQSYITVQGLKLAIYERHGKKPVLFFVHGNSSNAHAYDEAWSAEILRDYHLLSIDLPGHGSSEKSKDGSAYTITALSNIIAEIIDQKSLKEVILIGHSMGGNIATGVLHFTDKVVAVALAGNVPLNNAGELSKAYLISETVQTVFKSSATDDEIKAFSEVAVHQPMKRKVIVESYKQTDERFREEMGLELGRYFGSENFISEVELIQKKKVALCLICGAYEKVINLNYVKGIQGLPLYNNKVQIIDNAGHCVPFESPQAFANILAGFASHVAAKGLA